MSETYYIGSLLIITGALGVPTIVRVETNEAGDEVWRGVFGFSRGRQVSPVGKTIKHVCSEGDVFDDIGWEVRGGELVRIKERG